MIQIDATLANFNAHLHHYIFKFIHIALPNVLTIMIAYYQIDFTIQTIKYIVPFSGTS